jgi:hypothetical protein
LKTDSLKTFLFLRKIFFLFFFGKNKFSCKQGGFPEKNPKKSVKKHQKKRGNLLKKKQVLVLGGKQNLFFQNKICFSKTKRPLNCSFFENGHFLGLTSNNLVTLRTQKQLQSKH